MRLPILAICTLAALIGGTLSAKANPNEGTPSLPQQPIASEWDNSTSGMKLETTEVASDRIPLSAAEISPAEASSKTDFIAQSSSTDASQLEVTQLTETRVTNPCIAQASSPPSQVAQGLANCPRPEPIPPLRVPEVSAEFESSPGLSIYIPVGFGADRNTLFVSGTYQATTRDPRGRDHNNGAFGVGIGLGNADRALGLELSYVFEEFDNNFGDGGFNAKLHRRFGDVGVAVGWNGFANLGRNDFEHSRYGVITGILRTQESIRQPFSRISITAGVGDGQFRSNGAIDARENNVNVFGNVALRVFEPVSAIVEWTGTDLAAGLSIAPIRNFPWVITPAVRDIIGAGDEPRFVLGTGISIRF